MGCCMSRRAAVQDYPSGPSLWGSSSGDHLQPIERELNSQTESMSHTDRGELGTNTEVQSEALSASSTGAPDMDEGQSQADRWSVLNDEIHGSGRHDSYYGTGADGMDDDINSEQRI